MNKKAFTYFLTDSLKFLSTRVYFVFNAIQGKKKEF